MIIHQNVPANDAISIQRATSSLGVSRCGYYRWIDHLVSDDPTTQIEMKARDEMQKIAIEFPKYGYRRMTVELENRGYNLNHKRVLRLMREDNLLCIKRMFKPRTTDSDHGQRIYPNLIKDLDITGMSQVWASDITYIQLVEEFVYLAVIIDLFSRRCIGRALGRKIDTQLTLDALNMAIDLRWDPDVKGLIHHSDQGVQYASREYVESLEHHNIEISMSRKGNPYDNAFVESFIKTLKFEEVYLNEYPTLEYAQVNIYRFIDDVYNKKRLHSSLGYKSPERFEEEQRLKMKLN